MPRPRARCTRPPGRSHASSASRGITVNCVSPGLIDTAMSAGAFDEATIRRLVPLQRAGTPDDVAHAVAFLASDAASYITGQILSVNGGMT